MLRSRRRLLQAGLAFAPLVLGWSQAAADEPAPVSQDAAAVVERPITRGLLQPHVGESFHVDAKGIGPVELTLGRVGDLPSARAAGAEGSDESFVAEFKSRSPLQLPQGTYDLQHRTLGSLTIFLVPVDRVATTDTYEATFNRLRK